MSKFTVLVAHDVPNYGTLKIEARDADHALEILKAKDLAEITKEAVFDPAWDSSICARIVHIEDEHGNVSHEDTPLDETYAEWCALPDLTSALRDAEALLSGFDTRKTPAALLQRINAVLAKAGAL
jgi:hypothetical protein